MAKTGTLEFLNGDGSYEKGYPRTSAAVVEGLDDAIAVKTDSHNNSPDAHKNGIGGNAATATKLAKSVSISIGGAVTGTATQFDGSAAIQITATQLDASKLTGTATVDTTGKATTAGTADTSKSCSGNSATATKATQDSNGNNIATFYAPVSGNAGSHNALFRGKDLTSYFDSGAMSTAISNGTFDDIYPGDYIVKSITVNGATTTYDIVIGDCDYHLHRGDAETTAHHVLAFTRVHIGNEHMNATNTTAGGYIGSDMWKTILPKYTTAIKNAFGSSHILTHRELLGNAESDTIASAAGAGWSGGTTNAGWYNGDVNLFNEPMVYGCRPFSSSGFDIGDCDTQVAAMRHDKSLSFTRTYLCWLRAVTSSSSFAVAGNDGVATYYGASSSDGGVRVYFLLK